MSAILKENAEAVATALNGEAFSLPFAAQVSFRPRAEVRERNQLAVLVVPGKTISQRESRGRLRRTVELFIVIQRRLWDEDEDIGQLLQLAEEIETFLNGRTVGGQFTCTQIERDPAFVVEHVDQMSLFTTVMTATWVVIKS
jgi:hypothetical protein